MTATSSIESTITLALLRRSAANGTARRLREANALSLADVAAAVGTSKGSISKYERGLQAPRGERAHRYAVLLMELAELGQDAGGEEPTTKNGSPLDLGVTHW